MTAPDTAAALARARQQLAASPYELAVLVTHIDAQAAQIVDLQCQIGTRRMCVNCGHTRPASEPKSPMPECVGPGGLSACTWDATPQEAWEYWCKKAHDNWDDIKQQAATIDALAGALRVADAMIEVMAAQALALGLEGTSDWDQIAGRADLYGTRDTIRAALTKIGGAE